MAANVAWVYAKKPAPVPVAADIFELRPIDMPQVKEGMVMVRTTMCSVAPHSKAFLELPGNNTGAETVGLKRTKIGEVILTEVVAEVVESQSSKYAVGDLVTGFVPLQQYWAFRADGSDSARGMAPQKLLRGMSPTSSLSLSSLLTSHIVINRHPCGRVGDGCAGGCFSFLWPKQKTVLVTSAAGGVGLAAGQIYKSKGCRVIGVTSTKEKAQRLKEFGFDHAIAYKEEDLDARLGAVAADGIDVFFDNVGAGQLDVGSKHMKVGGRIVQVGCAAEIDNFTTGEITGWKEYHRVGARELHFGGFMLTNHFKQIPAAVLSIMIMMKRGKLRTAETVVKGGWDKLTDCIDRLRTGDSFGRIVLEFDTNGTAVVA
mmetsp:Transcript_20636/g.59791  ORF Transcript_20636/g.59791 Transcript_20636/m.59791 type:complete len:372 (-) Transcript_20636:86-1201(-)